MSKQQKQNARLPAESQGVISLGDVPLHSTNLISLLDAGGFIHYQSPSIERLLGFEQDELVGTHCTEVFHPDDIDRVYDAFTNVVESDQFVIEAVEYRHLTGDGTYLWVESVASANPTPNGYYVINSRDISELKRQQRELERANERLEGFASVVSHDLRNPLGVAKGYLELAEAESPSDHHATVLSALERMEALIDSLLSNTKIETEDVHTEAVDLATLSETCWQHVVSGEATLETAIERSIYADLGLLSQLLENLFRNAIEHGREDVRITVGELDGGFYVEDDGSGIPADVREAVFDLGYTTSSTGTGLGLSIVERITDSHGWALRITESERGGARFEITNVDYVA